MSAAKKVLLTNSERAFVLEATCKRKRVDGRNINDYRHTEIIFGADRGWCQVHLGKTIVTAHVSAEITAPKPARPVEGLFYLNLDLSPMAAPNFEPGRLSFYGVELNRLLEKCLQDSRCLDLESLCIVAGEKVWCVRVEVRVLNHDGSIIDCATIAAITALSHFKRPDVTVTADGVVEHPIEEKEPVPLGVYHMPLCTTLAFFSEGDHILVDPTELEEQVMEAKMVVAMNARRDFCTLQFNGGKMLLIKDQVFRCRAIAFKRVADLTAMIKKVLSEDADKRLRGEAKGFGYSIETDKLLRNKLNSYNSTVNVNQSEDIEMSETDELSSGEEVTKLGPGTEITNVAKWDLPELPATTKPKQTPNKTSTKLKPSKRKMDIDDSSEDEVMILEPDTL
uniref:Exosome complex component RRP45 n=1 Tax=Strigamia maritima TaxID=126957 RepID=T1J3G9_STRMM